MFAAESLALLLAAAWATPQAPAAPSESTALLDVLYAADALGLGRAPPQARSEELDALQEVFSGTGEGDLRARVQSLRGKLEVVRTRSLGPLRALARLLPGDVQQDIVDLYAEDPRYQELRGTSAGSRLAEMVLRDLRRIADGTLERLARFRSLRELRRWKATQRERLLPFAQRLRLRFGVFFVALEQSLSTPTE